MLIGVFKMLARV
jgi:hypothetical protein